MYVILHFPHDQFSWSPFFCSTTLQTFQSISDLLSEVYYQLLGLNKGKGAFNKLHIKWAKLCPIVSLVRKLLSLVRLLLII